MGFDNSFQLLLFLYALIFGIVLGAVYTGITVIRILRPPSSMVLFFADAAYFIFFAVVFFVFTFMMQRRIKPALRCLLSCLCFGLRLL